MFKVSQEIQLNKTQLTLSNTRPNNNNNNNNNNSNMIDNKYNSIFGRYQRTPDTDSYINSNQKIFIAPELTDTSKIQLLHFPNNAVKLNTVVNFLIKRNGIRGNFEVKTESPCGILHLIPLQIIDPERLNVHFVIQEAGLYKIHIKCNSVPLPKSPFIIVSITGESQEYENIVKLPIFNSDASKVIIRGLQLNHITLNERNEFIIDGSDAGNNILFVGIFGPKGQCDEVIIKHLGRNIYKVYYKLQDLGDYLLATKWGDEHISGSPFNLSVS